MLSCPPKWLALVYSTTGIRVLLVCMLTSVYLVRQVIIFSWNCRLIICPLDLPQRSFKPASQLIVLPFFLTAHFRNIFLLFYEMMHHLILFLFLFSQYIPHLENREKNIVITEKFASQILMVMKKCEHKRFLHFCVYLHVPSKSTIIFEGDWLNCC